MKKKEGSHVWQSVRGTSSRPLRAHSEHNILITDQVGVAAAMRGKLELEKVKQERDATLLQQLPEVSANPALREKLIHRPEFLPMYTATGASGHALGDEDVRKILRAER